MRIPDKTKYGRFYVATGMHLATSSWETQEEAQRAWDDTVKENPSMKDKIMGIRYVGPNEVRWAARRAAS